MRRDRRSVLLAYLRLPHALPVLIVLATTLALSALVDRDAPLGQRAALLFAMLGAQVVIGIVNELVDLELDRTVRPDKPLVSGLVSRRGASLLLAAAAFTMCAAGATLGWQAFLLLVAGCAVGIAYSLWFKRTVLAPLPYLVALPMLPVWVAVAHDAFAPAWLAAYPLGCAAILGVQVAQSLPDVESDRAAGIVSLTTLLGETRSLRLCQAALAVSALVIGGSGWAGASGRVMAAVVILAVAVHALDGRRDRARAVRVAFPLAAGATALLGIAWVAALT
jgi:4-hydroxybenzoate polyprenyltransferase